MSIISWLDSWLASAVPRQITSRYVGNPVLVFSDGACEYESAKRVVTMGALMYDPRDQALEYFGIEVVSSLQELWAASGKAQLVTEAEILPQLIARMIWKDRIRNSNLISFVDSEPAKYSCIKGSSNADTCDHIVRAIQSADAELTPWVWYSRVPSFSNPSDLASRLQFAEMALLFPSAKLVDVSGLQPHSFP